GLVGGECLRLLVGDPEIERIVVLTRRPLASNPGGTGDAVKVEQRVVDFDRLTDEAAVMDVEQVFCALGTTMRKAGSKERFQTVDLEYPLEIARLARGQGAQHFLLVSAKGASSGSRIFYNRVKGELEDAVTALDFPAVTIVRPSLLMGEREEYRLGERVAKRLSFLAPPSLRPVPATDVAAALMQTAREDRAGRRVIESKEISSVAAIYRDRPDR
nr:oxidoreductase [Gemmatimonadota bacterium]